MTDSGTMKLIEPTPEERLRRMRESFAQDYSVLAEDYGHFTGISQQDAATPQSKAARKSEEPSAPQVPKRS